MWLKFTVIWRFFRLAALAAGMDAPENIRRCFANNYDIEVRHARCRPTGSTIHCNRYKLRCCVHVVCFQWCMRTLRSSKSA